MSDVLKDAAKTFTFVPDSIWTGATCKVYSPNGVVLETPSVTLDAVDTTVSSSADEKTVTVSSATSISAGKVYQIDDATFGKRLCTVDTVSGSVLTLLEPLPNAPAASSTFKGIELTATSAAANHAAAGLYYRISVFDGEGGEKSEVFNVCHHLFDDPITEAELRHLVALQWPSDAILDSPELIDKIASDACQMVRDRLISQASWPHLMGPTDAFKEVGRLAARLRLCDFGLYAPGRDPDDYHRRLTFELKERIGHVIHSLHIYDSNADGAFSDEDSEKAMTVTLNR
tara:strand:+ start:4750 stop:5610 length:861 start_codon:yes stop_codon:yes gene_type:complete